MLLSQLYSWGLRWASSLIPKMAAYPNAFCDSQLSIGCNRLMEHTLSKKASVMLKTASGITTRSVLRSSRFDCSLVNSRTSSWTRSDAIDWVISLAGPSPDFELSDMMQRYRSAQAKNIEVRWCPCDIRVLHGPTFMNFSRQICYKVSQPLPRV